VQPPAEDILPSPVKQPHEVEMDADKADALKSGVVSALLTPGGIGNMFGGGKGGGSKATPSERRMRGGVASDDVPLRQGALHVGADPQRHPGISRDSNPPGRLGDWRAAGTVGNEHHPGADGTFRPEPQG
jgi:hypothetical protein